MYCAHAGVQELERAPEQPPDASKGKYKQTRDTRNAEPPAGIME
jgi:hypothetical protein